jgi:hypothetical protein
VCQVKDTHLVTEDEDVIKEAKETKEKKRAETKV